jgi:hypothetical protein
MIINLNKFFLEFFMIEFVSNFTYAIKAIDKKNINLFIPVADQWESFVLTVIPVNENISIPKI